MKFYVDGIPLQENRWKVTANTIINPALSLRTSSLSIPGRAGVLPSINPVADAPTFAMELMIKGYNRDDLIANITAVTNLLVQGRVLTRVPDQQAQDAVYEFVSAAEPEYLNVSRKAKVKYVLRFNEVYWRGQASTWTVTPTSGTPYRVDALDGMTGIVTDELIKITGPINNPKLACGDAFVQVADNVGAGNTLEIDCRAFTAKKGATDLTSKMTVYPGPAVLPLVPKIASSDPRETAVTVTLSGTALTSSTRLSITASGAFA